MRRLALASVLLALLLTALPAEPPEVRAAPDNPPFGGREGQRGSPEGKPRPRFTVGKETTFATGPRREDGGIDYVAALNERLRGRATPETNAKVLIMKALGPRPE